MSITDLIKIVDNLMMITLRGKKLQNHTKCPETKYHFFLYHHRHQWKCNVTSLEDVFLRQTSTTLVHLHNVSVIFIFYSQFNLISELGVQLKLYV